MMRVLNVVIAVVLSTPLIAQDVFPYEKEVEKLVEPYVDAKIINGLMVGVVKGDKSWSAGFGQNSTASAGPPTENTIYEIGSITKVFTGILLADAVESGRLKLDQPIGSLLTSMQTKNKEVGESILLRHLTTHSSGLPRLPGNWSPADATKPYVDYSRADLTEFMNEVKPKQDPGEPTGYSNLAVGLLGDLLAAEAGVSYDELLKRTIAKPLKMKDTCLALDDEQTKRLAPPHNVDLEPETNWEFDALAGAGAIRSTTSDMIRFMQANLDPPAGSLGTAIDLAWQEHLPATGDNFAMGFGWHIARDGQTRWHNGQTGGYHTMMFVNREIDTGVVVLCNTATGEVDTLAESLIQMLAGAKVKPRDFSPPKKINKEVLSRLEGRYRIAATFVLTVRADEDRLLVQATNQPELRVYPDSETKWSYRVVDAQLTFELPEEGPCKALTLHQNGRNMRGPRIEE